MPGQHKTPTATKSYQLGRATDIGFRRKNQDRCGAVETPNGVLLILADGMGGHPKGERASELVVETSSRLFRKTDGPIREPLALLERMVKKAHHEVVAYGQKRRPPIEPRSTAILALVQEGRMHWAHVGDSRLYLLRKGELHPQTVDHSYVQRLRDQGVIADNELETHPFRNYVTRCIGGTAGSPTPTFGGPLELEHGDLVLLCSDGVWGQMDAKRIAGLLPADAPLEDSLEQLIKLAVHAGAPSSDNATIIALRWTGAGPPDGPATDPDDALTRAIADIKQALSQFHEDD